MANYKVEIFVPLDDASGNSVDPTTVVSAMEALSSNGTTIEFSAANIFVAEAYIGQGNWLFWVIADTNIASARSAYNTFFASDTWISNVMPRYIATAVYDVG